MPDLKSIQAKAAKAILNIFETGSIVGKYDLLVVLTDGAGITYGKTQTTENGSGLYDLLKYYTSINGAMYATELNAYMDMLYDGKDVDKKGALTDNDQFKTLLRKAAREDQKMREAQDRFFHRAYFVPALRLCDEYDLNLPLSVAMVYDSCIHSGPTGTEGHLSRYDDTVDEDEFENYDSEEEIEQYWSGGYIDFRLNWLKNFKSKSRKKQTVVRKTIYRPKALKAIADTGNWQLVLPFDVVLPSKTITVTEESLANVH